MRLISRCATATGVALTVGACGDAALSRTVTVVDSAGVEAVTNARELSELPFRAVPDEPEVQVASEALYELSALRPLANGRLAVGVSGAVLIFREGEQVAQLGSSGEGPGEFQSVGGLVELPGDSLAVYDPRQRRLNVFPLERGAPRVLSLDGVVPPRGWSRVHPLGEGLALVGDAGLGGRGESGIYRNTAPAVRISLSGEVLATFGEFPGLEAVAANGMVGRAPFGALLATTTTDNHLVVGTGERTQVLI